MNAKLTPEELYRITEATAPNHSVEMLVLLSHIAAVEAERDELAALLREIVDKWPAMYEPGELTPYCIWCGGNMWLKHMPTCITERVRATLATLEGESI